MYERIITKVTMDYTIQFKGLLCYIYDLRTYIASGTLEYNIMICASCFFFILQTITKDVAIEKMYFFLIKEISSVSIYELVIIC